jgi:hypothetical protein
VEEATHFPLVVKFERGLLEAPDAQHVGEQFELLLGGEFGVDGGLGKINRTVASFRLVCLGYAHVMVGVLRVENLTMHGQTMTARAKVKMLRKNSFLATANEHAPASAFLERTTFMHWRRPTILYRARLAYVL